MCRRLKDVYFVGPCSVCGGSCGAALGAVFVQASATFSVGEGGCLESRTAFYYCSDSP